MRTGERATRTNALKFRFLFWLFFQFLFFFYFKRSPLKSIRQVDHWHRHCTRAGAALFLGCYSILFSIPRSFFAPFLLFPLLLYILICCQLLSARLHGVVGTSRVICSNTVAHSQQIKENIETQEPLLVVTTE